VFYILSISDRTPSQSCEKSSQEFAIVMGNIGAVLR